MPDTRANEKNETITQRVVGAITTLRDTKGNFLSMPTDEHSTKGGKLTCGTDDLLLTAEQLIDIRDMLKKAAGVKSGIDASVISYPSVPNLLSQHCKKNSAVASR